MEEDNNAVQVHDNCFHAVGKMAAAGPPSLAYLTCCGLLTFGVVVYLPLTNFDIIAFSRKFLLTEPRFFLLSKSFFS